MVHRLLLQDVNINATDSEGRTPLHSAVVCRNQLVFEVLLEDERVDLEVKDLKGEYS